MSIRRPVQISEFKQSIEQISDAELLQIRKEVTNSINKLNELILLMFKEKSVITKQFHKKNGTHANTEEASYLNDDDEATQEFKSDIKLYDESIQENKIVLRNNYERSQALAVEIEKRGLQLDDPGVAIFSLEELAKKLNLSNEEYLLIKDEDQEIFEINSFQGTYI